MLVVSDASPINILVRLEHVEILASLFSAVVVPASVADEMSRSQTPKIVRDWINSPPSWLSIRMPSLTQSPASSSRHRGERDAIQLAQELKADAILLDEARPRNQATKLGLLVVGTIGLLEQAANRGLIPNLKTVHDQLRTTNFFISGHILEASLARHLAYVKPNPAP
jgi:predicted nucleic acid-binding protein